MNVNEETQSTFQMFLIQHYYLLLYEQAEHTHESYEHLEVW